MLHHSYADAYKTISYIDEISEAVQSSNQDTLVVFDVDYVISTPPDLIGRQKAQHIKHTIFKEYEEKYGENRVIHIHSLYWLKTSEEFVEPQIKEIIIKLQERDIPTIALTAVGAKEFGNIKDPIKLRISRLKEKGINFSFENLSKRILWDDEVGYESGIIFSGNQSKGKSLEYFLENIAYWKPKDIIFVDDLSKNLDSVYEMCHRLNIKFTGFHYKAAVFDQDQELSPEVARLQLKTLDEKGDWISDFEAYKQIKARRK